MCSFAREVLGDESSLRASERDLEFADTEGMWRIAADEVGFEVKWVDTASTRVLVSCFRSDFWWSRFSCWRGCAC